MNKSLTNRAVLRWRFARAVESTGRTGWLGLVALILAVFFALTLVRGMAQRTAALERELSEIRQGKTPVGSTAALPRLLPGPAAAADFATLLHTLAATHTVRVERMEYQMQRESGKPILLYRADVVATAPYLKLRAWLDAILAERPTVALDDIVLERSSAESADVIARLKLTLFMRGEP